MKKKQNVLIYCLVVLVFSPFSFAEYEIKKGAPYKLCQEFKEYLNRHEKHALMCQLYPDDAFRDFTPIKWQNLAPKEHQKALFEWAKFTSGKDEEKEESIKKSLSQRLDNGTQVLRFAEFNIDHFLRDEKVLSFETWDCEKEKVRTSRINIIVDKHFNLDTNYGAGIAGLPFHFQGRVFVAFDYGNSLISSYLIFEPQKGIFHKKRRSALPLAPVCNFVYKEH